eukprot:4707979-Pyramimonas_sp.AAC.1
MPAAARAVMPVTSCSTRWSRSQAGQRQQLFVPLSGFMRGPAAICPGRPETRQHLGRSLGP